MECAASEKLWLDLARHLRLRRVMDEDTIKLIAMLGTRMGMIMEDTNEAALTLGRMDQAEMATAITGLDAASTARSAMVSTLKSIAT